MAYPTGLQRIVDYLEKTSSQQERIQFLISYGKKYSPISPSLATPPYPDTNKVEHCESEAYVWVFRNEDGTAEVHFAVQNPQGVSAMAFCSILKKGLTGESLQVASSLPEELVYDIFGHQLSMGKNMGLMGIVRLLRAQAKQLLYES